MNRTLAVILSLLLTALFIAALPVSGEEEIYSDVIRLHVIAASDSDRDQEIKLAVRDAILLEYGERLGGCADVGAAAEALTEELLLEIEETARQTLIGMGEPGSVCVTFSEEEYPTREYPGFRLPGGRYLSLRVIVGAGEGKNWWCVLYPPLCTAGAIEGIPFGISDAEYEMVRSTGWSVRFKALELLSALFD